MRRLAALLVLICTVPAFADFPCPSGFELTTQSWFEGGFTNYRQICAPKPTPTPIQWQSEWSQWIPTPVPTRAAPTPQPTFAYVAPTPQTAVVYPTPVPTMAPFVYVPPTPQPIPTQWPTPVVPTPAPTLAPFVYVPPTPQALPSQVPTPIVPTPVPTLAPPTPQPTFAYTAPTPLPTATPPPLLSAVYDPASLAAGQPRCDTVTVNGVVAGRPVVPMPQTTPASGCVMSVPPQVTGANTVRICWRNVIAATTACDTASSTWIFTQP